MLVFILKRFGMIAFMLLGLLILTFSISHVAPGDPARLMAGVDATEEMVTNLRAEYGLDKPLHTQFILYLKGLVVGDWGQSLRTTRPVLEDILRYFPATLELVLFSILFSIVIAIPLGAISAYRQNSWIDHLSRFLSVSGVAMPMFWLAILLQLLLSVYFDLLPTGGRLDMMDDPPEFWTGIYVIDFSLQGNFAMALESMKYMLLPAITLSFPALASIIRVSRAEMLEILKQDYIITAQSSGIANWRIVGVYALRNAMLPTLAMIGLRFGWMLGGTVVVEKVYDFPGIGLYAVDSAISSDFQPILGSTLVLGFFFMFINLVIDLTYAALDPRVRHQI